MLQLLKKNEVLIPLASVSGKFLSFIILLVNGALLSKTEFGLLYFVLTIAVFLESLTKIGTSYYLIQKQAIEFSDYKEIFTIEILKTIVLIFLMYSFASKIEYFFGFENSAELIKLVCISLACKALINPAVYVKERESNFVFFYINVFALAILFLMLFPFLYFYGYAPEHYIWIINISSLFVCIATYLIADRDWVFSKLVSFREVLRFSFKNLTVSAATIIQMNLLLLVAAKLLDVKDYGDFYFAYQLLVVPVVMVVKDLGRLQISKVASVNRGNVHVDVITKSATYLYSLGTITLNMATLILATIIQFNSERIIDMVNIVILMGIAATRLVQLSGAGILFGLGRILQQSYPAATYVLIFSSGYILLEIMDNPTGVLRYFLIIALVSQISSTIVASYFLINAGLRRVYVLEKFVHSAVLCALYYVLFTVEHPNLALVSLFVLVGFFIFNVKTVYKSLKEPI